MRLSAVVLVAASGGRAWGLQLLGVSAPEAGWDTQPDSDLEAPYVGPVQPWPYPEPLETSVWLLHAHRNAALAMYYPLFFTLAEGFSAAGLGVSLVDNQNRRLLETVRANVAAGRQQLVIAVAFWFSTAKTREILRDLGRTPGCHVVLYQTEPPPPAAMAQKPTLNLSPQLLAANIQDYNATEFWDYSKGNLECCYPKGLGVPFRYVPPGAARALDLGVDLNSSGRQASLMAFMGLWDFRSNKTREFFKNTLGERLEVHSDVWGAERTRQFLSQYPVQANIHKHEDDLDGGSRMPVEAFRLSQLLMNHACVISTRSHPSDEAMWKGIVHFARPGEMTQAFSKVQADVSRCQSDSFQRFTQRFSPQKLLRDAGVYSAWLPLLKGKR